MDDLSEQELLEKACTPSIDSYKGDEALARLERAHALKVATEPKNSISLEQELLKKAQAYALKAALYITNRDKGKGMGNDDPPLNFSVQHGKAVVEVNWDNRPFLPLYTIGSPQTLPDQPITVVEKHLAAIVGAIGSGKQLTNYGWIREPFSEQILDCAMVKALYMAADEYCEQKVTFKTLKDEAKIVIRPKDGISTTVLDVTEFLLSQKTDYIHAVKFYMEAVRSGIFKLLNRGMCVKVSLNKAGTVVLSTDNTW